MAGYVYISYAHSDNDAFVDMLVQHLTDAGIPVWYDRKLSVGDSWTTAVSEKIAGCSAFLVVMTPEAEASAWVMREISLADRLAKPILPLLRRGKRFFGLADIQYIDVRSGQMPEDRLTETLWKLIQEPTAPPPDVAVARSVEDPGPTKVFINYRREDSEFAAYWLFSTLIGRDVAKPLPRDSIFIDVGTLVGGDEFYEVATAVLRQCRIMLVLIGANWLTATDDQGIQRLHLKDDMLREEIEIAIKFGVKIVPVLLGQTRIPHARHLPESVAGLQKRHAIRLDPDDFVRGVDRLAAQIDIILAKQTPPPPVPFRAA